MKRLSPGVGARLGYYVYALIDPRDGYDREIFYVGKGKGDRALHHDREALLAREGDSQPDKISRIRAIRKAGCQPRIDIVRHGLEDKDEAHRIEAALIDCIGLSNLTNKYSGHRREKGEDKGRVMLEELEFRYKAKAISPTAPKALLIRLKDWQDEPGEIEPGYCSKGHGYKVDATPVELVDATRSAWRINRDRVQREGIQYAVAVHRGVTRGVMKIGKIEDWTPKVDGKKKRWAFPAELVTEGKVFDQWVGPYGKEVNFVMGSQNPINYWYPKTK